MKVRRLFIFIAFLAASASALAVPRSACDLLTSSEAQVALGEPVGPARLEDRSSVAGGGSSCRYRSTTGQALNRKSVSLEVRHSETDLTGTAGGIGENLKSAGFKDVHEVAGVGSAAIWGSNSILGRRQGELTVIEGKSVMLIIIVAGLPDEAETLARARIIAARALGRL